MSLIGKTVGKCCVFHQIGRGGIGTVYQGYDPALDRMVAIRVLTPALRANNRALPPAVETVLRKALAKRPDDRYPTATVFANALGAAFQAPAPGDASTTRLPTAEGYAATMIAPAPAATALGAAQDAPTVRNPAPVPAF